MGESRKGRVMVQTNDGELAGIRRGGRLREGRMWIPVYSSDTLLPAMLYISFQQTFFEKGYQIDIHNCNYELE